MNVNHSNKARDTQERLSGRAIPNAKGIKTLRMQGLLGK